MPDVPDVGGDTLFSDMYAAYENLPDEVKEETEAMNRKYPMVEHPVVRTHPETGRKGLYVNVAFTQHIVGMEKAESDAMLAFLYAQAAIPEYQCRFRWKANSLAFWDNCACQHYAVSDYWPAVRRMERATIIGDRPY